MSIRSPLARHCLAIVLGAAAIASTLPVLAQDQTAESRVARSEARPADDDNLEERPARDWGLQAEEWTRYPTADAGTDRHLFTQPRSLDSAWHRSALGSGAAPLCGTEVRAEARRAEKTLAYQRAYDEPGSA